MKSALILLTTIVAAFAAPLESDIQKSNGTFFNALGFGGTNGGVSGGYGGPLWTVWDAFALRDALNSNDRRFVRVMGRIDLTPLYTGSPGVRLNVGRDTTIQGGDKAAEISGGGITIKNVKNVHVENMGFHNALSYAPGEQPNGNGGIISLAPGDFSEVDAIQITGSENVWVDHCEFSDDPWNALATPYRHDGLVDVVRGSNYVTISNNIFWNHNKVSLIGNSDNNAAVDAGKLKTTYFGNWFKGTVQRNPRVRFGEVHILNNLYTDISKYGVGVGAGSSIVLERNVFLNCRRGWGFASGVPKPAGNLMRQDNIVRQNSGFDDGIPSAVSWRPANYYNYNALNVNDVENHVRRYAGKW